MNRGERITVDIVQKKLSMETFNANTNLPVHVDVELIKLKEN